jgi:trans-aconitate 2-methyltransferase
MNHTQQVQQHYDTLDEGAIFVRPADMVALAQARDLRPDARILDIGCGQGQAAIALAAAYPQGQVIGLDLAPQQIEKASAAARASRLSNVNFQVADWQQFQLPPDGVDLILSTQVIQFIEDEHAFAQYIANALAANGHLLLRTVLLPDEDPGRSFVNRVMRQFIRHTIRFYSERDLTELLREVGLSRFRIDKEEMWLDELPAHRAAILQRELTQDRLTSDDVQPWFWSGTLSAIKRA